MNKIIDALELAIFRNRLVVIVLFIIATIGLGYQASQLKLDAGFTKNIPLNHPYMKNYIKHSKDFGGANSILVSVCNTNGDIYNENFFDTLKLVHDEVFFIPGVDRALVKSIFSSSTRFTEIVEGGFSGGPVIPADFNSKNKSAIETVSKNITKAGIVGDLIADDFSCAMVKAQLLDIDPDTGEQLNTIDFAAVSYTHLRAHETPEHLVCRLLLEKKKQNT